MGGLLQIVTARGENFQNTQFIPNSQFRFYMLCHTTCCPGGLNVDKVEMSRRRRFKLKHTNKL